MSFVCFTTALLKLNEVNKFPMCQVVFGYEFLRFEAHLVCEHVCFDCQIHEITGPH